VISACTRGGRRKLQKVLTERNTATCDRRMHDICPPGHLASSSSSRKSQSREHFAVPTYLTPILTELSTLTLTLTLYLTSLRRSFSDHSVDAGCSPGSENSYRSISAACAHAAAKQLDGTDRRTDGRTDGHPTLPRIMRPASINKPTPTPNINFNLNPKR